MKASNIIPFILAIIFFTSCSQKLRKGEIIYSIKADESGFKSEVTAYEITESVRVEIKEVEGKGVQISKKNKTIPAEPIEPKLPPIELDTDPFRNDISEGSYYFPDKDYSSKASNYFTYDLSVQAVNIAFKNRFRTNSNLTSSTRDSFPSTWSSSFSPGFSLGYTITKNKVLPSGETEKYSITAGSFLSFGTTDINKSTTRDPVYNLSRKSLTFSQGLFVNLGFQKWDLGFAYGWERAGGPGKDSWVYQGQPFSGFIIGYDLVKIRE